MSKLATYVTEVEKKILTQFYGQRPDGLRGVGQGNLSEHSPDEPPGVVVLCQSQAFKQLCETFLADRWEDAPIYYSVVGDFSPLGNS